uniref:Uncharacterized protein n=1 Tax=Anguilla anguilla TaxID=7936 RepID=A0A0E9PGG8_ANGAN
MSTTTDSLPQHMALGNQILRQ